MATPLFKHDGAAMSEQGARDALRTDPVCAADPIVMGWLQEHAYGLPLLDTLVALVRRLAADRARLNGEAVVMMEQSPVLPVVVEKQLYRGFPIAPDRGET